MEACWRKKEELPLELVDLNHGLRPSRIDWDEEDSLLELRLGPPGKTKQGGRCSRRVRQAEKQSWPRVLPLPRLSPQRGGEGKQGPDNKAFSCAAHTAVFNSYQKRMSSSAVVGWPPICSSRRNLSTMATTRKQHPPDGSKGSSKNKALRVERANKFCHRGSFVKINMDGVPIGRKVDLEAYDGYEKLASAVDDLFSCLLAAQRHCSAATSGAKEMGLFDREGEYTLVYEDNEGDRMLVGDVPWHMFVLTARRLRVLKSSAIAAHLRGRSSNVLSPVSDSQQSPTQQCAPRNAC